MTFKEKEWIPYKRKAKFVEINVKDNQNQTIDFFKLEKDKSRDIKRIIKKIREQYGFDLNSIDEEERKDWLKKDLDW